MTQSTSTADETRSDAKAHRRTVAQALNDFQPATIFDICCGDGWVPESLTYQASVHGMDLYTQGPKNYDFFLTGDFNLGLPDSLGEYDAVICCEAMGYLQNPGTFLQSVRKHLKTGGKFILSVPNPNFAGARVNHLIQGFPRSYSWFSQNETPEPHMPWLTLGLFQLWLILGLNGFKDITVLEVDERKPRRLWEKSVGWIIKGYARKRFKKAQTPSVARLWEQAQSDQIVYGRQLVISATAC